MKPIVAMLFATAAVAGPAVADPVEIMLSDRLDGNLDFYCLDISGSQQNADVTGGLQTHTCYRYQGQAGVDQIFDSASFEENTLYMPEFDVCVEVEAMEAGASIGLATCDGSDAQSIAMTEANTLTPVSAPELCLTAGEEVRLGRGGTSEHQIRSLTLQACDAELNAYQQWEPRGE